MIVYGRHYVKSLMRLDDKACLSDRVQAIALKPSFRHVAGGVGERSEAGAKPLPDSPI
jgi:hypothetical protein